MSILKVTKDSYETITIVATPTRTYSSSSSGVTGSVKVFPRLSSFERDTASKRTFFDESTQAASVATDTSFDQEYDTIVNSARDSFSFGNSMTSDIESYFSLVSKTPTRANQTLEISRLVPTSKLTSNTLLKNNIKDSLSKHYLGRYRGLEWAYKNYNCLNFFTSGPAGSSLSKNYHVPTSSVLLYPNAVDTDVARAGYASGSYSLSGAFSFDFHINPRYKTDGIDDGHFKAGTIFHLSSSYALSLVTGSAKDSNGLPVGFRLQLQLSHSADYAPSKITPGTYPSDLVFLSRDNSLSWNKWHHVVVRWGTSATNDGTGSFVIDGSNAGNFVIPSGTISPQANSVLPPDALCIGNFYEGPNVGSSAVSLFFSPEISAREGVTQMTSVSSYNGPLTSSFKHPLKAEVHDLIIRRYFMSDAEITATGSTGPGLDALVSKNIALYIPPFFVQDTPIRRQVGDSGGVLQTPFFEINGTTDDPFNVAMAFGVNGHYINLENFVKDFATNRFPRLMMLSASVIDYTTQALEANDLIYNDFKSKKRNLTVLPCDDGNYTPNYEILTRERLRNKYQDGFGTTDYSLVNLDNLLSVDTVLGKFTSNDDDENVSYEDFRQELIGPTPEYPGREAGSALNFYIKTVSGSIDTAVDDTDFERGVQRNVPLTILQRLQDPSSNQITMFSISNLYYGTRILPGSFTLIDTSLSGSHGTVNITLTDDGFGGLYRNDALTPADNKNTVGNIFYDEGIVVIKNPHLNFFGKDGFEMSFKGVKNIYTTKYEILAPSGMLNSSSNPTYLANKDAMRPSGAVNDNDNFVYISGMYFHDENMNVVAKAKLAQPIIKRQEDKILFKVALDW